MVRFETDFFTQQTPAQRSSNSKEWGWALWSESCRATFRRGIVRVKTDNNPPVWRDYDFGAILLTSRTEKNNGNKSFLLKHLGRLCSSTAHDSLQFEQHQCCSNLAFFNCPQLPRKIWWKCRIYEHSLAKAWKRDQSHSHPDMFGAFHLPCILAQSHLSKGSQSARHSCISQYHWPRWQFHSGTQGQIGACWCMGTMEYHHWSTQPQCAFSQSHLPHICTETNRIIQHLYYIGILVLLITLFGLHREKKVVGSKGNRTTVLSWQRHRLILPLGHRAKMAAKSGGIVFLSILGVSLQ